MLVKAKKKKILTAIDNGIISLDIKNQLDDFGYDVEIINVNCTEKIKSKFGNGYDLIILESSPDIDEIKNTAKLAAEYTVPIIYLSTETYEDQKNINENLRILLMPFGENELKDMVKLVLGDL